MRLAIPAVEWVARLEAADAVLYLGHGRPAEGSPQGRMGIWWLQANEGAATETLARLLEALGEDGLITWTLGMRRGTEERYQVLGVSGLRGLALPNAWRRYVWKRARVLQLALAQAAQAGLEAWWAAAAPKSEVMRPAAQPGPAAWLRGVHQALGAAPRRFFSSPPRQRWGVILLPWEGLSLRWEAARTLSPPPDRFWADPCLVEQRDEQLLFVEEKVYGEGKAHLACLRVDAAGQVLERTVVLERPYHLSYPFVFQAEGEWWLVPESAQNRTVDLYRAQEFPYRWRYERTLLRGDYVDATLTFSNGRWWLFCAARDGGGSALEELWLFSARHLWGEWQAHPANPLWMDVRQARPAGRLFRLGERWLRPAQDSSRRYGYAVRLQEVLRWTEKEYAERTAEVLLPPPGLQAMHTFSVGEKWVAVDGVFAEEARIEATSP